MIDLDDDRLDAVLASVGRCLDTSAPAARRPVPVTDIGRRRRGPLAAAVLTAAAVATAVIVIVAPVREAVADWLGIGSTRIEVEPTPPSGSTPVPGIQTGLPLVDRAAAEAMFDFALPSDGTALGPPAGFARMPQGGGLVVWPDGSTLWIHRETVDPDLYYKKLVGSAAAVRRVDDLGDSAIVVDGPHRLQTPHRTVSAATTVLWRVGALDHRLESDRSSQDLVTIAREIASD